MIHKVEAEDKREGNRVSAGSKETAKGRLRKLRTMYSRSMKGSLLASQTEGQYVASSEILTSPGSQDPSASREKPQTHLMATTRASPCSMLFQEAKARACHQQRSEKRAKSLGQRLGGGEGPDARVAEDDATNATEAVDADVDRSLSGGPASVPAAYSGRYERMWEEVTRRGQRTARQGADKAGKPRGYAGRTF